MNRVQTADWAATVPWSGIQGKPANVTGATDLSAITWNGVQPGFPYWNGSRFVSTTITSTGGGSGTTFAVDKVPGAAVRRKPPGMPDANFENVFTRYVFNAKEYGAVGDGGYPDAVALNRAIAAINTAGGGALYIPAGAYYLESALDRISVPCLIYGDGIGVTRLMCNYNNGFDLFGDNQFTIAALSLERALTAVSGIGCSLYISDLGFDTSYRGIAMENVTGGCINGVYGVSTGTAAVGIYGSANALEMAGISLLGASSTWGYGIQMTAGTANLINGIYVNGVGNNAIYLGTAVSYSRITNVTAQGVLGSSIVNDLGLSNYVNEIHGIGGNTDTRYESRKELYKQFTWAPGGIQPGFGFYDDFTLEGARYGDQMIVGVPMNLAPSVFTNVRASGIDSARLTVLNAGTSAIFIGTSLWSIRALN